MTVSRKPHIWLFNLFSGVGGGVPPEIEEGSNWDLSSNYKSYEGGSGRLLLEYDAVVWRTPEVIAIEHERNRQLQSFLEEGSKVFVFLLDRYTPGSGIRNSPLGIVSELLSSQYGSIEHVIRNYRQGQRFMPTSQGQVSPFRAYLESSPQRWNIAFEPGEWLVPLAVNTEGDAVAFCLSRFRNRAYFLPAPTHREQVTIFLQNLLEALNRSLATEEPAPSWTNEFPIPGMENLQKQIERASLELSELQAQISTYKEKLDELVRIRNTLLFGDGRNLEQAVNCVLAAIGYNPIPGPVGQQDLTFEHEGKHFLAEVKGSTSSASETHIKQLNSKKTQFIEDQRIDVKGVLIINPWRQHEPAERENKERLIFPEQIMALVNIWKFSLMTTMQLLQIYRLHLEGKLDSHKLASDIYDSVGPLKGYELIN
jgi:hypothetical protein